MLMNAPLQVRTAKRSFVSPEIRASSAARASPPVFSRRSLVDWRRKLKITLVRMVVGPIHSTSWIWSWVFIFMWIQVLTNYTN